MPKLAERTLILLKKEAEYGVDPNPSPDKDFVAVADVSVTPDVTYLDPAAMDGSLSPREGRAGRRFITVTFTHELQLNAGEPFTTAPIVPALEACGFAEVAPGVFQPVSSGFSSCTIWVYYDGLLWKINGCRGNVEFNFTAGEWATLNFTFTGLYSAPTDEDLPLQWTERGSAPLKCIGGELKAWGLTPPPVINALTLNMNNEIQTPPSITGRHGITHVVITNRNPEGSIDPEMESVAAHDWEKLLSTPVLGELAYTLQSDQAKFTLRIPQAQLMGLGTGTRDGLRTYEIPFKAVRDKGDDEVELRFEPIATS